MDIRTSRFGGLETISVSPDDVYTFPEGMPGFERHRRFALIDDERAAPFRCLQATDDPDVGFLVIEPNRFTTDYEFELADEDATGLDLDNSAAPLVLAVLVIPVGDVRAMTANLQAPVVLNPRRRLGKQIILADEQYPLRHPVFSSPRLAMVGS